jgi:ribonuclease HI
VTRAALRTDGGARGNPGPAGAGFVIEVDGEVVCAAGRYLGECTNNVAEYEAVIWGLENCLELGYRKVTVFSDSELLVKQLNGQYCVKNEGLKPLFKRTLELLRKYESFDVVHVRRENNRQADALANEAMDARDTVGNPACEPGGSPAQGALF